MVIQDASYRFDDFELDPARRSLVRGGSAIVLRPKVFDVLLYLVQHRNVVVTKEELLAAIWNDTVVTDDVVYRCIIDIRTALGDDRRQPRFIRTIPKSGYRFV